MCASSLRGAPQAYQEYSPASTPSGALGTYPADCAASHNNNRAAVRYSNPSSNAVILSIWDLNASGATGAQVATFGGTFGGTPLKSGEQTNLSMPLLGYWPSDRIELTNTRGVSIGSGFSGFAGSAQDETYIEVFTVNGASPALLNQWVITPSSSGSIDGAGYTNDVAITREGDWAVVNSDNWIYVVEFNPPLPATGPVLHSFNIGAIDYSTTPPQPWSSPKPCTPNQAVDSIALLNDVAIVSTGRIDPAFGTITTWVYILDLSGTTPAIVYQGAIPVPANWDPQGDDTDRPHDIDLIQIDDMERYGVVTTRHGVAAYDLITPGLIGSFFNANDQRLYQWQVDSVESTDSKRRAVVICDDISSPPPQWKVQVYKVATGSFTMEKEYKAGVSSELPNRAHDLAVDVAADKAIVRTSYDNVILTSLAPPPATATVLTSPNGSNAHEYRNFRSMTSYDVFSSDSVVICPESGGQVMAVTIGSYVNAAGLWTGGVDFIDLAAGTLTVSQTNIPYDPSFYPSEGCVPVDLAISSNYPEVVVRSIDTPFSPSSTIEADVARLSLTSPYSINLRYSGTGTCNGVDSIANPVRGIVGSTPNKRVLSVSQDTTASGLDYAHISN